MKFEYKESEINIYNKSIPCWNDIHIHSDTIEDVKIILKWKKEFENNLRKIKFSGVQK